MYEMFRYKQIVKALTVLEDLRSSTGNGYAIQLHRNEEVYNFLSHSLRVYSKNLFTMTRLSKNYLAWGQKYPSIKTVGDIEDIFHHISGSLLFPSAVVPEEYSSFYSDKHFHVSETYVQSRGASFYVSANLTLSADEKLNVILDDIQQALTFLQERTRENNPRLLVYYIGILDYLKSHLIVLLHAYSFNERYGEYRLANAQYQRDREVLIFYATTFIRMYYQAILGFDFDSHPDWKDIRASISVIVERMREADIDASAIKEPELEHPLVVLESASCVCQKVADVATVLAIPSGGTEYAIVTILLYEKLRDASDIQLVLMPISRYSKERVLHTSNHTANFREYLKNYKEHIKDKKVLILDDNSNTGLTATLATEAVQLFHPASISFQVAEIDVYRTIVKNTTESLRTQTISNPQIFDCAVNMVPITYHDDSFKDFRQMRKLHKLEVLRSFYMGFLPISPPREKMSHGQKVLAQTVKICAIHNEYDLDAATTSGVQWIGVHLTYRQEQYGRKLLASGDKASYIAMHIRNEYIQDGDLPIPWGEYESMKTMLKNASRKDELNVVFLFATDNVQSILASLKLLLPESYSYTVHVQVQIPYQASFVIGLSRALKQSQLNDYHLIQTVNMNGENPQSEIGQINDDSLVDYILMDTAQ